MFKDVCAETDHRSKRYRRCIVVSHTYHLLRKTEFESRFRALYFTATTMDFKLSIGDSVELLNAHLLILNAIGRLNVHSPPVPEFRWAQIPL